ncbi:hypothetical protein FB451DRAFT_1552324 [Mycena latifolia]|nr:hypothetical protein FB451DRAFT_1552324 [Mycena latifolia]
MTLSLVGSLDRPVQATVKEHAHRLQNLELRISSEEDLEDISTAAFSSLKKLTLNAAFATRDDEYFRYPEACLDILRAAPTLIECDFINVDYMILRELGRYTEGLTHPCLRHLRLGIGGHDDPLHNWSNTWILQYLVLPALQTLVISHFTITPDIFLSFLKRSSPPLLSLQMDVPPEWEAHTLNACFRFVPSVTTLVLSYPTLSSAAGLDLLRVMLAVDSGFLPNLRNLTIHRRFTYRFRYETLVSLLTARRASSCQAQLQVFRLVSRSLKALDADTVMALRQLLEDGMTIHIGTKGKNCT